MSRTTIRGIMISLWTLGLLAAAGCLLSAVIPMLIQTYHAHVWQPVTGVVTQVEIRCKPTYFSSGRRGRMIQYGPMDCAEAQAFMQLRPDKKWLMAQLALATIAYEAAGRMYDPQVYALNMGRRLELRDEVQLYVDPNRPGSFDWPVSGDDYSHLKMMGMFAVMSLVFAAGAVILVEIQFG